ncbi:MAG: phosphatidate cytidylyltransferase [Nitrospiraceae bacterium]|nr:phosphatidate cytidylyltransferase [Nitrospiraceae bacterium]
MHLKRLATAAVLVPVFYLYITKLSAVWFDGLVMAMGLLALWEFLSFYRTPLEMKLAGMFFCLPLLAPAAMTGRPFPGVFALLLIALAALRLFARGPQKALAEISVPVVALLYIPGLLLYQMSLRGAGAMWIIFLYGTVWIGDSFALYVGRSIGRRKLYPEVSPNKTVEGAAGSVIGGAAAGFCAGAVFHLGVSIRTAALLGALMGATAIIGDLIESMFKRDAAVKDSSSLFPGHGGMLDKLDGPLVSAPVLYWCLLALGLRPPL